MKLGWEFASFSVVGLVSWVVLGWAMTLVSGSDAGDSETPLGLVGEERRRIQDSFLHRLESYLYYEMVSYLRMLDFACKFESNKNLCPLG